MPRLCQNLAKHSRYLLVNEQMQMWLWLPWYSWNLIFCSWSEVKWKSLSRVWLFVTPWTIQSWNSPGQNTGVGSLSSSPEILPNPGIKPRSPTLQADSLPTEPPGKPKNTGVGSLSLLQRIFWPRNQTRVPCLAAGFFTNWAIFCSYEFPIRIIPFSLWLQLTWTTSG